MNLSMQLNIPLITQIAFPHIKDKFKENITKKKHFIDSLTGAHFNYSEMVQKLLNLQASINPSINGLSTEFPQDHLPQNFTRNTNWNLPKSKPCLQNSLVIKSRNNIFYIKKSRKEELNTLSKYIENRKRYKFCFEKAKEYKINSTLDMRKAYKESKGIKSYIKMNRLHAKSISRHVYDSIRQTHNRSGLNEFLSRYLVDKTYG